MGAPPLIFPLRVPAFRPEKPLPLAPVVNAVDRQPRAASVLEPSPSISKPLPKAWARKASEFTAKTEPQNSYKANGTVTLNEAEAEADEIKADFENALVGRIIVKNLRFEWVAAQLQTRWVAYEGFRINDLGNGCFILFFANRESRDEVWLGGPWHVPGYTLGLDQFTG